jgi:hypothetical protein
MSLLSSSCVKPTGTSGSGAPPPAPRSTPSAGTRAPRAASRYRPTARRSTLRADDTVLAWAVDHVRRFGVRFALPAQPHDLPNVPQTHRRSPGAPRSRCGMATASPCVRSAPSSAGWFGINRSPRNDARLQRLAARRRPTRRRRGAVVPWPAVAEPRRPEDERAVRRVRPVGSAARGCRSSHARDLGHRQRRPRPHSPASGRGDPVAIAPDDRHVAVGLTDGRVLVATVDGGAVRTLRPHGSPNVSLAELPGDAFALTHVVVTPDSSTAIAVFDDGNGIAWPLRLTAWETRACRIAGPT